ncbi:hypothetical protein PO909_003201 [Leuciscus waleckii]
MLSLSSSSSLHPGSRWPVARGAPSLSMPPLNLAARVRASGPETGDPAMEEVALREIVSAPLPPEEEDRVKNLLFRFVSVPLLAPLCPAVPTFSIKEQFLPSLGHKRAHIAVSDAPMPFARCLGAWLALPSPSRWLIRTIRLVYAIQFAQRPPKF